MYGRTVPAPRTRGEAWGPALAGWVVKNTELISKLMHFPENRENSALCTRLGGQRRRSHRNFASIPMGLCATPGAKAVGRNVLQALWLKSRDVRAVSPFILGTLPCISETEDVEREGSRGTKAERNPPMPQPAPPLWSAGRGNAVVCEPTVPSSESAGCTCGRHRSACIGHSSLNHCLF